MEVFVTPRAEVHFDVVVTYIKDTWGAVIANQFIEKVDAILKLLGHYPAMGSVENGDIRGFQITHQTRMLYRVTNEKVIVLAFFDVRQDPDRKYP